MESTYKLIWSDEALSNLKNIINYLENRQIYIVTLFDNRQDPKKLKGK